MGFSLSTLDSGIDVGQGINVGHGKFDKMNKHRALNKRRAWKWINRRKLFFWFLIFFQALLLKKGKVLFCAICKFLFKAICLSFLTDFPDSKFIPYPTSIPESRVFKKCKNLTFKVYFLCQKRCESFWKYLNMTPWKIGPYIRL